MSHEYQEEKRRKFEKFSLCHQGKCLSEISQGCQHEKKFGFRHVIFLRTIDWTFSHVAIVAKFRNFILFHATDWTFRTWHSSLEFRYVIFLRAIDWTFCSVSGMAKFHHVVFLRTIDWTFWTWRNFAISSTYQNFAVVLDWRISPLDLAHSNLAMLYTAHAPYTPNTLKRRQYMALEDR